MRNLKNVLVRDLPMKRQRYRSVNDSLETCRGQELDEWRILLRDRISSGDDRGDFWNCSSGSVWKTPNQLLILTLLARVRP